MWVSAKETRGFIPLRTLARDLLSLECHPHKAGFAIGMMLIPNHAKSYLPFLGASVPYVYGNIWRHATLSKRNPAPPGIYESLYEVALTTYELVPNFLPSTVGCVWMCLIPSSQVVTVTSLQSVGRLRRFSKGLIYLIYLGILNASLRITWKCNATHKGYPPNNEKLYATWVFYPKILGAQHYFGYSPRVPPNFPKQSQFLCLNDPGDSLPHWRKSWACLERHFKDKAKEWMVTVGSIRPDYPCVLSA